jgi:hypothetical protein
MNWKKIVAREFLILLGSTVLYIITIVLLAYFIEKHHDKSIDNYNAFINTTNNVSEFPFKLKLWFALGKTQWRKKKNSPDRYHFQSKYIKAGDTILWRSDFLLQIDERAFQEKILQSQSDPSKQLNGDSEGFSYVGWLSNLSVDEFADQVKADNQSAIIAMRLDSLESAGKQLKSHIFEEMYGEKKKDILIPLLTVFAIIFYVLRYLLYAIRWSVRQLRE